MSGLLLGALLVVLPWACGSCSEPAHPFSVRTDPVTGFSAPPLYGHHLRSTILDVNGPGVGLVDLDGDGRPELYVGQGSTSERHVRGEKGGPDRLFSRDRHGVWRNRSEAWGLDHIGWSQGVAVGDYDLDGDRDLYITNFGANVLLRNDGDRLIEVGAAVGVDDPGWGTSAAFGDADGDGDPDLYVANYLHFDPGAPPRPGPRMPCRWKGRPTSCGPKGLTPAADVFYENLGDGHFVRDQRFAVDRPGFALGVLWADLDEDEDLDLFVANDSSPNFLFVNQGGGRFEERGFMAGVSHSGDGQTQASMGIALGDPDLDGDPDLVLTHFSDDHHTFYRNQGEGIFFDDSFRFGLGRTSLRALGWGTAFADFDLDGDEDLYLAHGHVYPQARETATGYAQGDRIYFNEAGSLVLGTSFAPDVSRAAAFGDVDNNGTPDAVVMRLDGPPILRTVTAASGRHWIRIRLEGPPGNPDGTGARVTLRAGDRTQHRWVSAGGSFQAANDPRPLFGLGAHRRVDDVTVRWPGGETQTVSNPDVDRELVFAAPNGGMGSPTIEGSNRKE